MARHGVKGVQLAAALRVGSDTVSRLKTNPPPLTFERIDEIAAAVTKCSRIGGIVRGVDLIENVNGFVEIKDSEQDPDV